MTTGIHHAASRLITIARSQRPVVAALAMLALVAAWTMAVPGTATAHAPGIAVAEIDLPLLASPTVDAAVVSLLPAGAEMELTGDASADFVEVIASGTTGWVDVNGIQAGLIDTATVNVTTWITAAPSADGQLLTMVPAGETVILTGAAVDQYVAGSYQGTGGWLPAANLTQ